MQTIVINQYPKNQTRKHHRTVDSRVRADALGLLVAAVVLVTPSFLVLFVAAGTGCAVLFAIGALPSSFPRFRNRINAAAEAAATLAAKTPATNNPELDELVELARPEAMRELGRRFKPDDETEADCLDEVFCG